MALKVDLKAAKDSAAALISVRAAVAELARSCGTTEAEAAHWLALQRVHEQLPAYLLYPLGYATSKLVLSADRRGVWQYDAVYDELVAIAYPPPFVGLLDAYMDHSKPPPVRVAWVRDEFQEFVVAHGGTTEAMPSAASGNALHDEPRGVGEMRRDKLLAEIQARFVDPMHIPLGEKARLGQDLCRSDPKGFTPSTFDKAWQELSTSGEIAIENKETFARRLQSASDQSEVTS